MQPGCFQCTIWALGQESSSESESDSSGRSRRKKKKKKEASWCKLEFTLLWALEHSIVWVSVVPTRWHSIRLRLALLMVLWSWKNDLKSYPGGLFHMLQAWSERILAQIAIEIKEWGGTQSWKDQEHVGHITSYVILLCSIRFIAIDSGEYRCVCRSSARKRVDRGRRRGCTDRRSFTPFPTTAHTWIVFY